MVDLPDSVSSPPSHSRHLPVREDCWSEDATSTLIDTWGRRYIELNRGNLRQKDWQDVADAVNALHGHTKKTHRTDVQCKNRIDTIKKKYKVEKARVSGFNGAPTPSWPFYDRLDSLIGSSCLQKKPSPSMPSSPPLALPWTYRKTPSPAAMTAATVAIPQKRSVPTMDGSFLRRNYSAMAAAAAAAEAEDDEEDEDEDDRISEDDEGEGEGMMKLARAIEKFGEVYERVEAEKLRQMVELEKQRMQFAKDLEVQRTQMFLDTQVQLERIKRGKKSASNVAKSAQFSLHVWLPDAMEGPTPISALIHAATMVAAGIFLVARFIPLFIVILYIMNIIALIGIITVMFRATLSLAQKDIKRSLTYSSMSQLGYMMLALGIGSYRVALFHLIQTPCSEKYLPSEKRKKRSLCLSVFKSISLHGF